MVHDAAISRKVSITILSNPPPPKKLHDNKNFLVEMRECARQYWISK